MSDITIRGLRKSYGGVEIVHAIDLDVRNGEFLVVLGPSGCGKSTLLRLIAGLEEIDSGEILIDGQPVQDRPASDRDIAFVFQLFALYPHLTAYENIAFPLRAVNALQETGLAGCSSRFTPRGTARQVRLRPRSPGQRHGPFALSVRF